MCINVKELIKVSSVKEQKELLEYIGNDYKKVPYLYLDLEKYGVGNKDICTWYYKDNTNIQCIFLLYYDCLHIYTRCFNDIVKQAIDIIIEMTNPRIIITIDKVGEFLCDSFMNKYNVIRSYVMDATNISIDKIGYDVKLACKEDLVRIVDLFLKTEHYRNLYERKILLKQFEQRYDDGFGRFFVVKDGENIVGSLSIYAENDKFAIVSGLVTDSNYKRPGVAVALEKYVSKILKEESKQSVGFNSEENVSSLNLALKLGCKKVSDYYQFIKL